ncbi:hypothetical protein VNO77_19148 [Canavalia gladiata]|uniref:Uncharacterized protein n=1 Tax=Canavalia gladiata TaxID=3824 RepID=A0AAN9LLZ2_CANGL
MLGILDRLDKDWENPSSLLGDISIAEPPGNCELYVSLWWLKVEAHIDNELPTQRVTGSLLGITTLSEHASWLELPTDERVTGTRMAELPRSTLMLMPKEGPSFGNTSSPRPTRSKACMQKLNRRASHESHASVLSSPASQISYRNPSSIGLIPHLIKFKSEPRRKKVPPKDPNHRALGSVSMIRHYPLIRASNQ